jgi:hypothetical protein
MSTRLTLTAAARRRLGARASEYVDEHCIRTRGGGALLVADRVETPQGVYRTLSRLYGRPATIDRGEVAYWEIGGSHVERTAEDT